MPIDLSICIINHCTRDLLKQCLESITSTAHDLSIEILIVNNTQDNRVEIQALAARYPNTQFIQNETPLGFSANQNQLMRRAAGRYLMPLNSDTIIQTDALQDLVVFMDQHPRCAIAGPKLIHADGSLQPSCRNFPNAITHFLEASGMWQLLKASRFIGRWYFLCSPHDRVMQVDWLTGACLIVRREAVWSVGLYNEEMFPGLYGEDIEWCWRVRQAHWQIYFDPAAVVVHLENQSPLSDRTLEIYRGFYRFCEFHYSRWQQISIRCATVLALLPKWLLIRDSQAHKTYSALMKLRMTS